MKNSCIRLKLIVAILIFSGFACGVLHAQPGIKTDTTDKNLEKVKGLVSFLEFTLNTMGSIRTTPAEKDVIITQSFLKLFRDPEVQIEDDLDTHRTTVTNKDVQAYLKDIDFFFKTAHFTIEIAGVETTVNEQEEKVYLVKLNRNLLAVTIDDDSINNNLVRYLEVNYDIEKDDLKIASYYSTKLSEEEDLLNWWAQMSFEWRMFFLNKYNLNDSAGVDEIRQFRDIDSIDISQNPYISDLQPLTKCDHLQFLNIKNTYIEDLGPLRYLSKLQTVNISFTPVRELKFLHYSQNLKEIDLSYTPVTDFAALQDFKFLRSANLSGTSLPDLTVFIPLKNLKTLFLSGTGIENLEPLTSLINLEYLDITKTSIESLEPLRYCTHLKDIIIENTVIDDLSALAHAEMLQMINCESTNVSDLAPLLTCQSLQKILCDNSGVTREMSDKFNVERPDVLIIFESQVLQKWWNSLTTAWKEILRSPEDGETLPGKENLARIIGRDSLTIRDRKDLRDLAPLSMLRNLRYLDCSNSNIYNLSGIESLENVQYLNINHTPVDDLAGISELKKLKYLDIGETQVQDISPIRDLRGLSVFVADRIAVPESLIMDFAWKNPETQVIYRSDSLRHWWNGLEENWKKIFAGGTAEPFPEIPDTWFLHKIGRLEKLIIDSVIIMDLDPLYMLNYLRNLVIRRTSLYDISALELMNQLKSLTINKTPLIDFSPVGKCHDLEELDLSNTGFEEFSDISDLFNIRKLNLSGTKIKSLNYIIDFEKLKELDISNTSIKNLKPLYPINSLKLLICYNTRISDRSLENFRLMQPYCEIVYY